MESSSSDSAGGSFSGNGNSSCLKKLLDRNDVREQVMMREIEIIRSKRKTICLEIRPDCSIVVRAPYKASRKVIEAFVKDREEWLVKHLEKMEQKAIRLEQEDVLSEEEWQALVQQAKVVLPKKVAQYADLVGVDYGRITIRGQKTRWGSCSSKGNLNFNGLLMLAPDMVVDYVVVHELCHRLEMNHSRAFWNHVERIMPEYQTARRWLKTHGSELMARLHAE